MATVKLTNKTNLKSIFQPMIDVVDGLEQETLDEFKRNTPIRSGNARRKTDLRGKKIVADYAYANRLDEGYSKQAPRGMVEPTLEWVEEEIARRVKGIK